MSKKTSRVLFSVFLVLVLGISGCGKISMSGPTSQTRLTITNPSETNPNEILSEPANDTLSTPSISNNQAVPILYYHSIMREDGNELRMPPDQFEAQMAYLQKDGYQSLSLDQLYQAFYKEEGILPTKSFVITFDDGYVDNYTTAFPILKKYGFTATVFMVSSYINKEGFMSWPQLKELAKNGWEIEGHTTNHSYLIKLDPTTVINELKGSKEFLEKGLGQSVNFFAYPYGNFNAGVVQAVENSGYVMAVSTERGWADHNEDKWQVQRVYCYATMGMNEFSRRLQNPNY